MEKRGTIALLLFLFNKEPQRFRNLKKAVPREATLAIRIRELEDLKLIESVPIKDGQRKFFAYRLTELGKLVAGGLRQIEKL